MLLLQATWTPQQPGAVSLAQHDRPRPQAEADHEFIVGLDHELGPNFAVGAAYTYRKTNNWSTNDFAANQGYRFSGACSDPTNPTKDTCPLMRESDYTANAPISVQNGYTAFSYSPNAALVTAGRSGRLITNRDGYSTTYKGIEATLNKRLSNKWMARVAFTYADWTQNVDNKVGDNGNPTIRQNDNLVDGDQVSLL